jgi:hypothetical protein
MSSDRQFVEDRLDRRVVDGMVYPPPRFTPARLPPVRDRLCGQRLEVLDTVIG